MKEEQPIFRKRTLGAFVLPLALSVSTPATASSLVDANRSGYGDLLSRSDPALQGLKIAKAKKKSTSRVRTKSKSKKQQLGERLQSLKRSYRQGEIKERDLWAELAKLHDRGKSLSRKDRVSLLNMQANMLMDARFPVLAAIYASQAIKIAPNAADKKLTRSWAILRQVAEKRPIQNLLEVLAQKIELKGVPPVFGTDWHYFAGNSLARHGKTKAALQEYNKLKIKDRYFMPARYQQAMIHLEDGQPQEAVVALKAVLYPTTHKMSPLDAKTKRRMADYGYLAMGRIAYEQKEFLNSAKMYRNVSKDGVNFYDALFEQAWAFFLGGFPGHALGALHAVESPFYEQVFNPEAPILRALINFWLCRYDDSRNALADFMEDHAKQVESLEEFLDRKQLGAETAYQMFENLISGVSSDSLGIPRDVLQTAAEKDSLLLVRDQYATIIDEQRRLTAKGIFGSKRGIAKPEEYLERWSAALRKDVGMKFLGELKALKKDYDRLYAQAQFLYVELLMSEKDQLLGKQLHASSKITKVSGKMDVHGWGNKTQAWTDAQIGEYWWDEVGFYIQHVDSMCIEAGN